VTSPSSVPVQIARLHPAAVVPTYARLGDAGADLSATIDLDLAPGERAQVPTGIAVALPPGYVGLVHPRSGLAARCGLGLVNAPGTIDAGYRGEIMLIVINHDPAETVRIRQGDRIAQLVIQRVEHAAFEVVERLSESARGSGGHGSTGGAFALTPAAGTPAAGIPAAGIPAAGVPAAGIPAAHIRAPHIPAAGAAGGSDRGDEY